MDILPGLEASEASQRAQKPFLDNTNPVGIATAEAGPPLTPLSQSYQQQAPAESSPPLKKQAGQRSFGPAQDGKTNAAAIGDALEATDAAQRPAQVAPAPPTTRQRPAPRQNPIITNAISAVEEHGPWLREIPSVPVYTPSAEEWQDPILYIRSIQPEAGKFGACVVKAPIIPAVPAALFLKELKFTTRIQKVKDDPWGKTWADGIKFWDSGRKCTVLEYAKSADEFARRKLGLAAELPTGAVESMYWREKDSKITRCGKECTIEYGNDIEGSAFHPQDPLGQSNWNLNSFSDLPGSALRYCLSPAPGVTTPMLYVGMLYASFAWHVEDHFMYSINYSHAGASKVWYCVPASAADDFENTAAETVYLDPCTTMKEEQGASAQACQDAVAEALAGKTTTMSPKYLVNKGIPVYRAVQEAGSYVITFPRSYHSGFSTGFNLGEAVNFVLSDWWPFGEHAGQLYKSLNRQQIISHEQVLCDDAVALAVKLDEHNKVELDKEDRPVAIAFVAMMQQIHQLRESFQTKKIVQIATCSPDIASDAVEMRASIPCTWCSHQGFLASAVVDARKPQNQWEHVCLDCAARIADGDVLVGSGEDVCAPSSHMMVYLKPLWSTMEGTAKIFTALLAPQPVVEANDTSGSGGGEAAAAAAVVHQSLSLEGCSANAIENPERLSKYTWTELDDPVLYAPSWVAKQPQSTGTVSNKTDSDDGGDETHEPSQPGEKRSFRKRSRDEDVSWDSLLEEEEKGKGAPFSPTSMATPTATASCKPSPASLKKQEVTFIYKASASFSPTYDATFFREDFVVLPGKETPLSRKVYKFSSSKELVIGGSDIVKAISPDQAKCRAFSRYLGSKFYSATYGDASAPDRYMVFIKGHGHSRSPAIGKSGAKVLLNSEKMKQGEDYGALCAALGGVWDDMSGDSDEELDIVGNEEKEGAAIAVAPTSAPVAMKPTQINKTPDSSAQGAKEKKDDVSTGKPQQGVVEEEPEVAEGTAKSVKDFLHNTEPFSSSPKGAEEEVATGAAGAAGRVFNNTEKRFAPFPALFNTEDSPSPCLPSAIAQFLPSVDMEHSIVADPQEIDIEIEAESNKRTCDGNAAGKNSGHSKRTRGTIPTNGGTTALTSSTRLEDVKVPRLEADELTNFDLMEAEFLRSAAALKTPAAVAAAAPQQLPPRPPPVAAKHFVPQSQPQQVALAPTSLPHPTFNPQYNGYTSLPSVFTTSPQHQQQQQQCCYHHHQPSMGPFDARVGWLQNCQVMPSGSNWNAGNTTNTGAFPANHQHVDTNNYHDKQKDVYPLFVPPHHHHQQQRGI